MATKHEKLVESEILAFAFQKRWSLDVFDSAVIPTKQRQKTKLPNGTPDLVGNDDQGLSLYIELKRKNKEDCCRLSQHQFLTKKIESNAFACVISSAEQLEIIYNEWLALRKSSLIKAKNYLLNLLPKKVIINNKLYNINAP